ncbi:hypothetical protein TgHK011_009211 [Trichoderma gracile]|nr:hypothetical protein TgHK011_009211 [Trichoderma gracile]
MRATLGRGRPMRKRTQMQGASELRIEVRSTSASSNRPDFFMQIVSFRQKRLLHKSQQEQAQRHTEHLDVSVVTLKAPEKSSCGVVQPLTAFQWPSPRARS